MKYFRMYDYPSSDLYYINLICNKLYIIHIIYSSYHYYNIKSLNVAWILQGDGIIHLPKAKENVSEIKKCKRIPRIVYKLYRCIWKKRGRFIGHENIGVYKFYPNTSKTILNNSSCKIWRVYCQRQRLICR